MGLETLHPLTEEGLKIREGYKVFQCLPSYKKYSIGPEFRGSEFPDGLPKRKWIESRASCLIDVNYLKGAGKSYSSGWHIFIDINKASIWRASNSANSLVLHRVLVKDIIAIGYQAGFEVLVCKQIYIMEEIKGG